MKTFARQQEDLFLELIEWAEEHGCSYHNIERDEEGKPYLSVWNKRNKPSKVYVPKKYQLVI